jgi:hypothetical protein
MCRCEANKMPLNFPSGNLFPLCELNSPCGEVGCRADSARDLFAFTDRPPARGTLFVNVESSVRLSEIVRYRRKEILDRLQHSFEREVIKKISFRAG